MRLLPFRVICVLGLNDGDFPRRDPAAGLNQLTAELDTPRRRPGDRSTREDDRFLFLQLFAAAQEVFYLSYLGADPRDGSVREPSVLVSELIDAAAAYHLDPPAAVRDFTVRHALQPFSPAAFGERSTPLQLSAAMASRCRPPHRPAWGLQPWFDAPLPPPFDDAVEDELALDTLRRFLCDPAGQFLAQSMGLRLADDAGEVDDLEPLVLSSRGPEKRRRVVRATLSGDTEPLYPRLRAWPAAVRSIGPAPVRGGAVEDPPVCQCVAGLDAGRAAGKPSLRSGHRWRAPARPRGRSASRRPGAAARRHAQWQCSDPPGPGLAAGQRRRRRTAPCAVPRWRRRRSRPACTAGTERACCTRGARALLQLRQRGLREPLRFAPYTGWVLYNAPAEKQRSEGWKQWHGSDRSWGESSSDAWQLLLRVPTRSPPMPVMPTCCATARWSSARCAKAAPSAPKRARRAAHEPRLHR